MDKENWYPFIKEEKKSNIDSREFQVTKVWETSPNGAFNDPLGQALP